MFKHCYQQKNERKQQKKMEKQQTNIEQCLQ